MNDSKQTASSIMQDDNAARHPHREPLRVTLARTITIALVVGAVLARSRGGLSRWPSATLLALWPALGGHWVEIFFLNYLRPRLPAARGVQTGVRVAVWFVGGIGLAFGMRLTALALGAFRPMHWPAWWIAGLGFISIELIAHLILQLRGRPCFYNGRG